MVATEFQIEVLGTTYEPPRPQPVRGTSVSLSPPLPPMYSFSTDYG